MVESYKTILKPTKGLYKEKGSKFIALAYPIDSEEKFPPLLTAAKKDHHDARHHCYAYKIGIENPIIRINDDNEPTNTAGKPIFGQIEAFELTNVSIIVIRYFGGTLLGKGGLINAYRTATFDAIQNSKIIAMDVMNQFELVFNYDELNSIEQIIREEKITEVKYQLEIKCHLNIGVKIGKTERVIKRLNSLKDVQVKEIGNSINSK